MTFLWCLVQHWNKYYYARPILICIFIVNTGGPRISWFQNSWSPLFRDSVSGLNFVNSLPFWDFELKKTAKKISENVSIFFRFDLNFANRSTALQIKSFRSLNIFDYKKYYTQLVFIQFSHIFSLRGHLCIT